MRCNGLEPVAARAARVSPRARAVLVPARSVLAERPSTAGPALVPCSPRNGRRALARRFRSPASPDARVAAFRRGRRSRSAAATGQTLTSRSVDRPPGRNVHRVNADAARQTGRSGLLPSQRSRGVHLSWFRPGHPVLPPTGKPADGRTAWLPAPRPGPGPTPGRRRHPPGMRGSGSGAPTDRSGPQPSSPAGGELVPTPAVGETVSARDRRVDAPPTWRLAGVADAAVGSPRGEAHRPATRFAECGVAGSDRAPPAALPQPPSATRSAEAPGSPIRSAATGTIAAPWQRNLAPACPVLSVAPASIGTGPQTESWSRQEAAMTDGRERGAWATDVGGRRGVGPGRWGTADGSPRHHLEGQGSRDHRAITDPRPERYRGLVDGE